MPLQGRYREGTITEGSQNCGKTAYYISKNLTSAELKYTVTKNKLIRLSHLFNLDLLC
jgi:hypothetical protein